VLIKLKGLVGESGIVSELYGGYEITVLDTNVFPWESVFNLLLDALYEVWITRSLNRLVILSKPPVE
jgi:hypothetical protein